MRKALHFFVNILCAYSLIFYPAIAAAQSITVDGSAAVGQRPVISTTGGGKPQINIAPPTNGVSVNRYSNFSTNSGAIFNNSTAAGASRTGGAVARNTRLSAGAEAKVILNDVRGTQRSNLKGNFEIFGKTADLVITNQNGITCDGCAFINSSRTTLSTGAASVNANGDVNLNVRQGNVHIGRGGVTADGRLGLVGRTVTVDGPVNATVVDAIGGASTYNTRNRAVGANTSTGAAGSLYAVDATQFGAMTAGQIRIIGNEAGLGVRTRGKLTSTSTDVSLHSKAGINHASVQAKRDFVVRGAAGAVQQDQGVVTAERNIDINALSFAQASSARMQATGNVKINAGDAILIAGEIASATATYDAVNKVVNVGEIIASGDVQIVAGEVWNMRSARNIDLLFATGGAPEGCLVWCFDLGSLQILGSTNWTDRAYMIGHGGVVAAKNLTITSETYDINNSGVLIAAQSVLLDAKRSVTQQALKGVYRTANSGAYLKTNITKAKATSVANKIAAMTGGSVRDLYNGIRDPLISGTRVFYGAKTQGLGSVTVKAGHHVQNLGGEFKSNGRILLQTAHYDINLRSHGRWSHNFSTAGNVDVIAKRNINLTNAHFRATTGTLNIDARGGIAFDQVSIDAAQFRNLRIREMGDAFTNTFTINTPGTVNIASRGTLTGNRSITAASIYLQSTHGEVNQNYATRTTGQTRFVSSGNMRVANSESSGANLVLQSTAGNIYVQGNARGVGIDIDAEHSLINGTSTMYAGGGGINIWAGSSITNAGGRIWSHGNIDLLAGRKRAGNITSTHTTAAAMSGYIRSYGTTKNVRLDTDRGTITLTNNGAIASGDVTLDASGDVWIQRSHVEGNTVTLNARTNYVVNELGSLVKANLNDVNTGGGKNLYNRTGARIWAKRDVNVNANAMYNHGQPVTALRDIRLTLANRLENYHVGANRAVLDAGRNLVITSAAGDVYNRRSDIKAGGNVTINAGVDRVQMWDAAKLTTGGALSITSGESGGDYDGIYLDGVALRATSMTLNTAGRIVLYPGSDLTTTSGDLLLTAGRHFHQLDSDLTSAAAMMVNTNGVSLTGSRSQSVGYMKYDSGNWVQIYDGYGRNPVLKSTTGSVDVISNNSHVDTRNAAIDAKRYAYLSARNNVAVQTNSTVKARDLDVTLKAGVGGHIYYRYASNVVAGRDVRMDSRNNIYLHGRTLMAGRDINSNSRAQVEVYNDGASRAKLQAGRNISINSTQGRILTRTSDWVANTGNISINAGTHSVEFWGGATVATAGAFSARSGNWSGRGVNLSGMPITATSIHLGSGTGYVLLEPGSDLTATSGTITIDSTGRYYQRDSDVTAPGDITVTSNGAEIDGSLLKSSAGAISLTSGSNVRLYDAYTRNPQIWAAGAITIASTNSHFENRGIINGGGNVSVTSRNNLHNEHGALMRSRLGNVSVRSTYGSIYNRYNATLHARKSVSVRADRGHIFNHGGTIHAIDTDLNLTASHAIENHKWSTTRGRLEAGRNLTAQAGVSHLWSVASDWVAGGNMRVGSTDRQVEVTTGSTFTQGGSFTAFSSNYDNRGIRLFGTPITATSISLSSTSGHILLDPAALTATAGNITIDAAHRFYQRNSDLTASGAISITSNGVDIKGSGLTANGGGITLASTGSVDINDAYSRNPWLWASGGISVSSANSHVVNNGNINAGGAVSITSRTNLHNDTNALIRSRGSNVAVRSSHGNIYNRYSSRVIAKGTAEFQAVNIYNDGASVTAGGRLTMSASNHLRVIDYGAVRSRLESGTDANLSTSGFAGTLKKALQLNSGTSNIWTRRSDLIAGTTLSQTSTASSIHNEYAVMTAARSANLKSKGEFRATGGSLVASGVTIDSDHHLYLLTGHRLTARNGAYDVSLDAYYDYLLRDSFVTAGRDVTLSDARSVYIYDSETHAKTGKVDYLARGEIRHRIEDTDDSNTTAGTDVRMVAAGFVQNYRASIVAGGSIRLESTNAALSNNAADVRAGTDVTLIAKRNLHLEDTTGARDANLVAGRHMVLKAGDTLYADAGFFDAGSWLKFQSRLTPRFYAQVYDNAEFLHFQTNVSQGRFTSQFNIDTTGAIDIYARDGVTLNRGIRGDNWVRIKSGTGAIQAGYLVRSDNNWLEIKGGGDITLGNAQAAKDVNIESTAGSVINTYNMSSSQALNVKAHVDIIARHSVATRRGAFRGVGSVNLNAGRNMTITNALVSSNGQIDMLAGQKEVGTLSVTSTLANLKAGVENRVTDGKAINMVVNWGGHINLVGAEIYGRGLVNTYAGAGGGGQYTTSAANINAAVVKTVLRGQDVRQNANTLTLADTDLIGSSTVSQYAQQSGSITMDRGLIQTHNLRIEALGNADASATYRNLTSVVVGDRLVLDVAKTANIKAGSISAATYDFTNTPSVVLNGAVSQRNTNNLTIVAKNNLTLQGTSHRRNITLTSLNGVLANTGHLRANFDIRLTANRTTAGLNLRNDGLLQATRDVFLNAKRGIDPGRIQARNISVVSDSGIIISSGAMMAEQDITLNAASIATRSVLAQNATVIARAGSFSVVGWQVGDGGAFETGLNEFTARMGDIVGTVSQVVDGETEEVTQEEFEADLRMSGNAMFHVESDLTIETRDDINIRRGAILSSRGDIMLTAGKGVLVESWFGASTVDVVVNVLNFGNLSFNITEEQRQFSHRRAAIIADGDLTITALGNGLNLGAVNMAVIAAARDAARDTDEGYTYEPGNGVIWNSGTISAGGNLILNAAKDIVNKSTRVTYTLTAEHNCGYHACGRDAYLFAPGEIMTGQGLIMTAGVDILNDASQVAAAGSLYAEAGNDIYNDIQTAHFLSYYYKRTKRFLGIRTGSTVDQRYSAAMQSGVFQTSFGDIDLVAGRNIDSSGSYVSAGANARLVAGNDVYMDAISVELHNYYKDSGFSGFLTYSSTKTRYNNFETSMAQVEGYDVSIEAGNDLTGIGVILLAVNDLSLTAGNDMVYDAKTNRKYLEESGWSFGLTSSRFTITQAVLDNANNDPIHAYIADNPMLGAAYQLATAEDGWGRLNGALALIVSGARTLRTARDAEVGTNLFGSKLAESFIPSDIQAIQQIGQCGGENLTSCVLEAAGIGFRFDSWHSRSEWDESLVSRLGAGNDMFLLAGNDIQLAGGTIVNTGRDLVMSAGNDFLATALANDRTTESSSFGFGVSLFSGGFTISVDGSGSNSNSLLYSNASINAMNSITLVTGNDALLLGAVMQARPVIGVEEDAEGNAILDENGYATEILGETGGNIYLDIGNDLVIASQQNTSESNSWGFGLSLSFSGGTLSGIGINANIAEGRARYVDSPSMIDAHRILDIYVDNTTYLMGAVIASRNDGLYLDTGYLVHDNLFNEHNSYSVNVGLNIGVGETLTFDGTAGFSLDITEGFTRATISGGDVVVRNQSDFDISQINQDLDAVDTITRDTHINLQLPALNLVQLAEDLQGAGNYIRAATANVPDEVRARGDIAVTVYRRMIASGMPISEAISRTLLPEFQASVNAIRRVIELEKQYPNGGIPEDELFLMAIAEQALYDADGNIVLSVDCDLLGRCEIAAADLNELVELWRDWVVNGQSAVSLPLGVREQMSRTFTNFIIACAQENPQLIVDFVQTYGADAVAHLAEFRSTSQANVPYARGFNSAMLLTAIASYIETGDQFQLVNEMAVAQDTFLDEHGYTAAERQAAMSAFFGVAIGFVPVVGDAMDAHDLITAIGDGDIAGIFIAGIGFVPLAGDAVQNIIRIGDEAVTAGRRVGVDDVLAASRRDNVPTNYTRNQDGTVTGPNSGRYNPVGDPVLGEQVFRDSGGRYWIFRDGVKVRASNPAERPNLSNNLQSNPLRDQRAHHQAYVDDISLQLEDLGYEVANDVRFHASCGPDYCLPDIVYRDPSSGRIVGIIEVKTGNATLSTNQTLIYPQIRNGSSIPTGDVARSLGLRPGVRLRDQGYPNGINIYEQSFPGLNGQ
ncbi:filamentous hemagglutinin N-terminal domain-containing protein [uncultured Tateyamaria sp.]|uniref:two-partner secretion domain-containing protein n=1 Tax=uncultured Tateyamaria sp. TaxID=455651 RepID=UPI00260B2A5C|nr:filamentous hemagglutinin N-terminal domain-containing protein [uncultured Tateyamaria sp.]